MFSTQFGLPAITHANFEKHMMAPSIGFDSSWAREISLDVQWAHAIAPNANLLLVEAVDETRDNLLNAVDYARNRADVVAISMSWYGPEFPDESTYDSHFISPSGASFFAASGDDGAGVNWPAVSPNVVGVGGTTLTFANGAVSSETAWQYSGGGLSAFEPEPTYQVTYGVPGANGHRAVPDVSYYADPVPGVPYYTSFSGIPAGWSVGSGTSVGAPQWAAIHSIGQTATNNNFYRIAGSAYYPSYFRDVTAGSNGNPAMPNYDYVTGLGSPLTTLYDLPPGNPTLSGPTTVVRNVWYTYTTNAVTDPDGDQICFHLNLTGPGISLQDTQGWFNTNEGQRISVSWSVMWEPTDNPGVYLFQVWVEDWYGLLSHMASLTVDMIDPAHPLCAMKTLADGSFYRPRNSTDLRVEMLFDDPRLVGDQTGNTTSPYATIANYPDGKVDMKDIVFIELHFGALEGGSNWNYMADIVPDKKIDMKDMTQVILHYPYSGSYPPLVLSGVTVTFNPTGEVRSPDQYGFVTIPQGATSFTVKCNGTTIGAMIIFW